MKSTLLSLSLLVGAAALNLKAAPLPPNSFSACAGCHSIDLNGTSFGGAPGIAPSLTDNKAVHFGDGSLLAQILFKGIEKTDERYLTTKPPFGKSITDDAMAELMTYLRTKFDVVSSAVTPQQVKLWRQEFLGKRPLKRSEVAALVEGVDKEAP